ncbi:MAG: hypothetical protein ACFCD0_11515 [Gemmataceae bacterium]
MSTHFHPLFRTKQLTLLTATVPPSVKIRDQYGDWIASVAFEQFGETLARKDEELWVVDSESPEEVLFLRQGTLETEPIVEVFHSGSLLGYVREIKRPTKFLGVTMDRRVWDIAGGQLFDDYGTLVGEVRFDRQPSKTWQATITRVNEQPIAEIDIARHVTSAQVVLDVLPEASPEEHVLLAALAVLFSCDQPHELPSQTATTDEQYAADQPRITIEQDHDVTTITLPPLSGTRAGLVPLALLINGILAALLPFLVGGVLLAFGVPRAIVPGWMFLLIGCGAIVFGLLRATRSFFLGRQSYHLEVESDRLAVETRGLLGTSKHSWNPDELSLVNVTRAGMDLISPGSKVTVGAYWERRNLIPVAQLLEEKLGVKAQAKWEANSPPTIPIPLSRRTCVRIEKSDPDHVCIRVPGEGTLQTLGFFPWAICFLASLISCVVGLVLVFRGFPEWGLILLGTGTAVMTVAGLAQYTNQRYFSPRIRLEVVDGELSVSGPGFIGHPESWSRKEIEEIVVEEVIRGRSRVFRPELRIAIDGELIPLLRFRTAPLVTRYDMYAIADALHRSLSRSS